MRSEATMEYEVRNSERSDGEMKQVDVDKMVMILDNLADRMKFTEEQLNTMSKAAMNIEIALNRIADVLIEMGLKESDGK